MPECFLTADKAVLYWIQDHFRCGVLDWFMPKITVLGNFGLIWIFAGFTLLFFKKYRKYGICLLVGLLTGVLVGNVALKNLVMRQRPCWLDETVVLLIKNPQDFSFPSGHSLSSAISAAVLTKANRRFGAVAIPVAMLIAFSRLYLFVHFPSDVLTGIMLGVAIGLLAVYLSHLIQSKLNCKIHS